MRRTISTLIWVLAAAGLGACGGGGGGAPSAPLDVEPVPDGPFDIVSVSPSPGAAGVDTGSEIVITFTREVDPASVTQKSVRLSIVVPVPADIEVDGAIVRLQPKSPLPEERTVTLYVRKNVAAIDGEKLGDLHTSTFTTFDGPYFVNYDTGDLFQYYFEGLNRVWLQGSSTVEYLQERHVYINFEINGKAYAHIVTWDTAWDPDEPGLELDYEEFFEDETGFYVQRSTGLRRVLAYPAGSAQIPSGAFALQSGPGKGPKTTSQSVSHVASGGVDYDTLFTKYQYSTGSGGYQTEDVSETRWEHHARGRGVVRAFWNYDVDDNDPSAADVHSEGFMYLRRVGAVGNTLLAKDTYDNHTFAAAVPVIEPAALVHGDIHIDDDASTHADVTPNALGARDVQDWYVLELADDAEVRIDLLREKMSGSEDINLHLYQQLGSDSSPTYGYVGGDTSTSGRRYRYLQSLGSWPAGKYLIGVQRRDAGYGRLGYWLAVRTD